MKAEEQNQMQQQTTPTILCPTCGIQFHPRLSTICQACTLARTDITIGITKESLINYCRFCHRYSKPGWVHCERDSKELLAILLKKVRGLGRARIVNAGFIWTEEHSRRIKLKITIQKQMNNRTKIQQTFITQFIEIYTQCQQCKKQFTPHTWGAVVQVRQHVDHKKTFYYIQQLILKYGVYDKVLKVSTQDDGINFYFKTITHAQRLVDFLGGVLPVCVKNSKQLLSQDDNSNVFNYKYTFAVEIPKICRNDLVLLPKKLCNQLGGCSRLVLCDKVGQMINLIDLSNYNYVLMNSIQYQHYQKDMLFLPLYHYKKEFEVLDCQACSKKKFQEKKSTLNRLVKKLFMYTVTRRNQWENVVVKGCLGEMACGQLVEGFDLRELNYNEDLIQIKGIQDIILVRRFHEKGYKKRGFKLKKLEDEGIMVEEEKRGKGGKGKKKIEEKEAEEEDYQDFLDDVQADPQLRKQLNLYKNSKLLKKDMTKQQINDILGQIKLCEMLDDMNIGEKVHQQVKNIDEQGKGLDGVEELIAKMEKVVIEKE